ncbi:MAG: hypothetical protein R3F11_24070 [Verrucomicrobiales bacterium]
MPQRPNALRIAVSVRDVVSAIPIACGKVKQLRTQPLTQPAFDSGRSTEGAIIGCATAKIMVIITMASPAPYWESKGSPRPTRDESGTFGNPAGRWIALAIIFGAALLYAIAALWEAWTPSLPHPHPNLIAPC